MATLYGLLALGVAIAVLPVILLPVRWRVIGAPLAVAFVPFSGWALMRVTFGRHMARAWWLRWRFCAANCLNSRAIIARGERRRHL